MGVGQVCDFAALEQVVVPFPRFVLDGVVVFADKGDDFGEVAAVGVEVGRGFEGVGGKGAVNLAIAVFEHGRVGGVRVPRRVLAVCAAIGAVFIPNGAGVVAVAIGAVAIPNGFVVVFAAIELPKIFVVVLAAIDKQGLSLCGCAEAECEQERKQNRADERLFHGGGLGLRVVAAGGWAFAVLGFRYGRMRLLVRLLTRLHPKSSTKLRKIAFFLVNLH